VDCFQVKLAPDDGFDGEITQPLGNSTETIAQLLQSITQSPNNSELESRVNVLEHKLEKQERQKI
jgi:hypothetical protein